MRGLGGGLGRPRTRLPSPEHTKSPSRIPTASGLDCAHIPRPSRRPGRGQEPGWPRGAPSPGAGLSVLPSAAEWEERGAGGRAPASVSPAGRLGARGRLWMGQGPASPPERSARAPSGGCADRGSGGQKQAAGGKAAEPVPAKPLSAVPPPHCTHLERPLLPHGFFWAHPSPELISGLPPGPETSPYPVPAAQPARPTGLVGERVLTSRGERGTPVPSPGSAAAASGSGGHCCFSLGAR